MDKKLIIDTALDAVLVCMVDMHSQDPNKAMEADRRFQSLFMGLYNSIKSL